jgi:hypothetical protein
MYEMPTKAVTVRRKAMSDDAPADVDAAVARVEEIASQIMTMIRGDLATAYADLRAARDASPNASAGRLSDEAMALTEWIA